MGLISAEVGDPDAVDPVLSRLMLEAMREAERDAALRERLGALLGEYRRLMVDVVRADQQRGAVFAGAPPEALATLLGAVGRRPAAARPARPRARHRRRDRRAAGAAARGRA